MEPSSWLKTRAVLTVLIPLAVIDSFVMFAVAFAFAAIHGDVPPFVLPTAVVGLTAANTAIMTTAPRKLAGRWQARRLRTQPDDALREPHQTWWIPPLSEPWHDADQNHLAS